MSGGLKLGTLTLAAHSRNETFAGPSRNVTGDFPGRHNMCKHQHNPVELRVIASLSGLCKSDAVAACELTWGKQFCIYSLSGLCKDKLSCQVACLREWRQESENPLCTARAGQGKVEASGFSSLVCDSGDMEGHFRPTALPEDCLVFLPFVGR